MRATTFLRSCVTLLAMSAGLAVGGCSSSASEEELDEGALEGPTTFDFRVNSAKEKAGELEAVNAYWAARLAKISYDNNDEGQLRRAFEQIGLSAVEVIPFHAEKSTNPLTSRATTGTDGYYVRTRDAGFLVFRGSEETADDVIADIRFIQLPAGPIANNAGDGRAHAGFSAALRSVWDGLRDKLKARHGDGKLPLFIAGHSMGGSIGTIALHHLLFDACLNSFLRHLDVNSVCEREYIPVRSLYTFGSPRVGDEAFATAVSKRAKATGAKIYRFVNEGDQVAMLPRYSPVAVVSPYRHIGENGDERAHAVFLDLHGNLTRAPAGKCPKNDKQVQCDLSLEELAMSALEHKFPWKVEHSHVLYLEKLRATVTSTKAELDKLRTKLANE